MRKVVFGLLLLSFIFALACTSTQNNSGVVGPDKNNRWVTILVYREKDGALTGKVYPKLISITYKKHKLHFVVYNDLNEGEDIKSVDIDFGANAPFDDNLKLFNVSNVMSGFSDEVEMKLAKEVGNPVTYDYTVKVTLTNGQQATLDPQVEISGGRYSSR